MNVQLDGTVATGLEPVRDAFEASFRGKPEMGAALAIRFRGEVVADLWGGLADPSQRIPWRKDTLSVIFSCTKGLVSILAARLVQDGLLDYQAPVAEYWPEFAVAGKSGVRVMDLLAHRSGLSAPREPLELGQIIHWDTVVRQLGAQEPLWEPGTGYAYHAITHGWLIGEVIRRITGRSVGEYFSDLVAAPLNADAWIGLPSRQSARVASMQVGSTLSELTRQQAAARKPDTIDWGLQAMTLGLALPPELVAPGEGFNDPAVQAAEIPGAGGISTARALASIWSSTITNTDGVRLLDDATAAVATVPQSEGPPVWDVPAPWPRWGMGFQLDSEARRYLGRSGFGHDGAGGQSAFADPEFGIGFAFLTNQMEAIDDLRATSIIDALRHCLA
ncbi:serine hydrolase domain-containing protein [Microbacterium pumilum]|uniref:Serine hydrolase domain-containing protein n=1 Tax=Microbacterium pumilum TaxID=344165 RepID=A0ABP5EEK8_9MICO